MINLHLHITYLNVSEESVNKFYEYQLVKQIAWTKMTGSPSSEASKLFTSVDIIPTSKNNMDKSRR